jgi:DNA-binding transcriptional LysR family regulator
VLNLDREKRYIFVQLIDFPGAGHGMTTLKQIEALFWIAQLGSFERAAFKLNTTQSAISKRVQDLEMMSSTPLFDRSKRAARLTERGEQLLAMGKQMLRLRDEMTAAIAKNEPPKRRFRLGITELTALTWLPHLVVDIRERSPMIDLELEVESSQTLVRRLQQGRIDMIIVPDAFRDPRLNAMIIGKVENAWMCSPALKLPKRPIELADITRWTVLTQDERSGSGLIYKKWLDEHGIAPSQMFSSNSLIALMGLTVSGLGISYLPKATASPLLKSRQLRIVSTRPALPPIVYVAMVQRGDGSTDQGFILERALECCDFTKPIYSEGWVNLKAPAKPRRRP